MNKEKKKKTIILAIVAVVALLALIIGATYAYFTAQVSTGTNEDVTVQTHTSNTLTYNISKAISVTADDTNLVQNGTDRSDSATGTVTYKSGAEQSSACYTMDLTVDSNNFVYTTNNNTPELVLNVTKNGTSVITNADITTGTATVHVPTALNGSTYKQTITANAQSTVHDTWVVTVTFKNLATDQSDPTKVNNAEKTFLGSIVYTTVDCTTGQPINNSSNNNNNSETSYYWNNEFSSSYGAFSYPFGQVEQWDDNLEDYVMADYIPSPLYNDLDDIRTNYSDFARKPYYIKTTNTGHQACLYYNNHEFCLGANYWEGTIGESNSQAGAATLTKLENAMEAAFETDATNCNGNDSGASCRFGSFYCDTDKDGNVDCYGGLGSCGIDTDGNAECQEW